ncbi:glycosyltransferase family 2 protein [Methylococcus sp. EFPC2]|nr:glycosyltransferase family 2 protein [Methylococcus sp. EFPC2]
MSVIIPAYNAERFLAETLESVYAQTRLPLEIIVIDDGSSDGTEAVAKGFEGRTPELIYVKQENAGPSRARNTGIGLARGNWLAFLDADDLWLADKLERQIDVLRLHPEVTLLSSDASQFNEKGEFITSSHLRFGYTDFSGIIDEPFLRLLEANPIFTATVLLKTDWARKTRGFDESMIYAEDYDLWLRVAYAGGVIACQPDTLMRKRAHDTNLTRNDEPFYHAKVSILKRLCQTLPKNHEFGDDIRWHYVNSRKSVSYYFYLHKRYFRAVIEGIRYLLSAAWLLLTGHRPDPARRRHA